MSGISPQRLALAALLVAGALIAYVALGGIEKNLVYYMAPDALLARAAGSQQATVRLGGLVQTGSVNWNRDSLALTFRIGVAATGAPNVPVRATGAPPQMFQEGTGAVVEGTFDGTTFHAERVMVKHSNEYRPPAPGERPSETYQLPSSGP